MNTRHITVTCVATETPITSGVVQMSFKLRLRVRKASRLMPSLCGAAAQGRALVSYIDDPILYSLQIVTHAQLASWNGLISYVQVHSGQSDFDKVQDFLAGDSGCPNASSGLLSD